MNRISSAGQNVRYALLNAAYWMVYCITLSFASVFLVARGYSNAQIGVILASGQVLGLVLQPVIAGWTDRSARHTPVFFITATALVGTLAAGLLLVFPAGSLWLAAAFALFCAINMALLPLVNAFAFYLTRLDYEINFGIARGIGSLAFSAMAAVLGVLTERMDVAVLAYAGLISFLMLIVVIHSFHVGSVTVRSLAQSWARQGGSGGILRGRPGFVFLLAGTALVFFDHACMNNYMLQVVVNAGGSSGSMGALSSYCAILELPAMFLFDRLHRRWRCTTLLKVAVFFFTVKGLLVLLAGSVPMLFVGMFFQGLSFALFTPASVRYVDELLSPADANRGQACVTAMIAAGNIAASALGGVIIDSFSVRGLLLGAFLASCVGTALVVFGMRSKSDA